MNLSLKWIIFMLQIEAILRPLRLEDEMYRKLKALMDEDMAKGLSTDRNIEADLKMYITYVRAVPNGSGRLNRC